MSALSTRKLKQAQERLQAGDFAGAEFLCEEVLRQAPRNPDALYLLGGSRIALGRARDALPPLKLAVATEPGNGAALEHLGLAHLILGEYPDAERALREAAALPGAPASALMRLAIAILEQGRAAEAVPVLRRALALNPQDTSCYLNLGRALAHTGDAAAAREAFETVLRLEPGHLDATFNLGVISLSSDNLGDARRWFERVVSQAPRHADAYVNLGIVHQREGRLDEALNCFQRALALNPRLAPARSNLAHTLVLQRKPEEARDQYLAALQLAPGLIEARAGLAAATLALGRYPEGIAQLREVLARDAQDARAWSALADALFQNGDLDEAVAAATRARALDSGLPGPYSVLALIHVVRGETEQAIAVLEEGFERTGASGLLGMLSHQLRRACDWEKWRVAWDEIARRLDREADLGSPFWMLLEATTPEQQLDYTRRWANAQFGTGGGTSSGPRRGDNTGNRPPAIPGQARRVRVGYLSSEFHEHAIAYLLAGVLEAHDRAHFEIHAYSYGPEDHSPMRARLRQACEHFIDIAREPDDAVVRRIEADALDILVDLKGYTMGARSAILARRPCPIQVNWLGYPGTLGASFIDYLIADGYVIPPGQENAYSERVVRLNHCWQSNDRKRPVAEPLARSEYGLPDPGFVFCSFAQAVKITPDIFARWMNLLRAVPGSVLWLAEDNARATQALKDAAGAHGIAPERVVFSPRVPFARHLARYRAADLALDTFPYTSHSTASDALWCGCPLVALSGETFAARVSGSILTHAGLPDLITGSLDDYERLAHALATDSQRLEDVRSRVAAAQASSLFDAESFARDLERVYRDLVDR
jgi:predicted O-linked N-acetylglucosamine transferase (SPINDLY family)